MVRAAGFVFSVIAMFSFPADANAYMGPTLGLGIIGTALAVVAVVLLSVFAFVFVPIRRMLKKNRRKNVEREPDA